MMGRKVSLRAVLIGSFLVVAMLPIVLLSVQRYRSMADQFVQEELNQDRTIARAVAAGLNSYMGRRRAFLEYLGRDLGTMTTHKGSLTDALDSARRFNPAFLSLMFVDDTGVIRASSPWLDEQGRPNVGRRLTNRGWLQGILRRETDTSAPVSPAGTSGGLPTITMASPVTNGSGQVIGAVVGAMDVSDVRRSVKGIDASERERLVVVDGEGHVIAHASTDLEEKAHDLSSDAVFRAARTQTEGTVEYRVASTGERRWGTYVHIPASGWVVWASRGSESWMAKLRGLVTDLVSSALLAFVMVATAAFVLSGVFSRPLRLLAGATSDLTARRSLGPDRLGGATSRIREIDQLFVSLREMADTLRTQYDNLEAKVVARTQALAEQTRAAQDAHALLRAEDEIRQGYAELAVLLNSLDRSYILQEGTKKIAASLKAPLAAVYLTENGPETLRLKTYTAVDNASLDSGELSATGLPLAVAQRGEPIEVVVPDGPAHLRLRTGLGAINVAAVAGLPLRYQDRVLGVLVVALLDKPTASTRVFLDNAARQLSVALSNAGLFESVRYQSQQLETLNAKLGQANGVKSQFLASMSHELRTPLNSIIGFAELLLTSRRDPLSERQHSALEKVLGSGRHLLGLINAVLDLSKIEAARMEVHAESFPLGLIVHECIGTIEPSAQAKGLIVRGVDVDEVPKVVQDRGKMKQILLNLLSNAVKFTREGTIEVRVERRGDEAVAISVTDNGPGISVEDQGTIFEAFRQVNSAEVREAGGTGLGLPISRKLAELLGGTLTVTSTMGHGSTFTVQLPIVYGSTVPAAMERALERPPVPIPERVGALAAAASEPAQVLIIDDDRDAVDIIRRTVAEDGISIAWAPTAREGLARAYRDRPSLILLDVIMHGQDDGWEVLRALKHCSQTRSIPVIVHSAIDNAHRAKQLGAEEVLVKPVAPAAVKALFRRFPTAGAGDMHVAA